MSPNSPLNLQSHFALLTQSPLPFALVDPAGCICQASRGFQELTGLAAGETLPQELQAAPHEEPGIDGSIYLNNRQLTVHVLPGQGVRLIALYDRTELARMDEQLWDQQSRLSQVYSELTVKNHALNSTLEQLRQRESELRDANRNLKEQVASQLAQIERADRLRRYLSPEVASAILAQEGPQLVTRKRSLTILFADIPAFEELVADLESEEIIDVLNEYRAEVTRVLFGNGATLDKFMGARVMAFFGDPIPHHDHVERAVDAGLRLRDDIGRKAKRWFPMETNISIGINVGYVTVGTVGSQSHADYTVIGKNVTLAASLQHEARSGQILISAKVRDALKDRYVYESMQSTMRGSSRPMTVFNVTGRCGTDETQNVPEPLTPRSVPGPTPAPAPAPTPDSTFGPYALKEKLGSGGMGTVYKAFDTRLHRTVAIKILLSELCRDENLINRFIREARALASLSSPYIPQVYYISDKERPPFFAMEFIEGTTLHQRLREQRTLPCRQAVALAVQVAECLQVAQEKNITHRDIKPANIMLTARGQVKLVDFGIVKSGGDDGLKTAHGAVMGTPTYMAPEQALGLEVDHRADIYALGATLFHMLVGAPPFTGESGLCVMRKHQEELLPPLSRLPIAIPAPVYQIIERMMAKRPQDRFPTYRELLSALNSCQHAAA